MRELPLERLTREAFEPYGAVIGTDGGAPQPINEGAAARYHALAEIEAAGAPPVVSIFVQETATPEPASIELVERHPFGSQAFVPLGAAPWVVVVAHRPAEDQLQAFAVGPGQGVQIGRGVWHAPLICYAAGSRFLVIDRAQPEKNVEIVRLPRPVRLASGQAIDA